MAANFYRVDAFVLALSQHYRMLKEVIWDGKGKFELMSDHDASVIDGIADMIEDIGGTGLANYCRLQFQKAWFSYDLKLYDIRAILDYLRQNCKDGTAFKEQLNARFEQLVDLANRLSNPIDKKHKTKHRKPRKVVDGEQLLLFPELAEPAEEKQEKTEEEKPKKQRNPRKPRQTKPKGQKQKRMRRSKLDKLADEIIDAEYGNSNNISDNDGYEDTEDTYHDDACDHFSRGYSRMSGTDYDYFSGNCDY